MRAGGTSAAVHGEIPQCMPGHDLFWQSRQAMGVRIPLQAVDVLPPGGTHPGHHCPAAATERFSSLCEIEGSLSGRKVRCARGAGTIRQCAPGPARGRIPCAEPGGQDASPPPVFPDSRLRPPRGHG